MKYLSFLVVSCLMISMTSFLQADTRSKVIDRLVDSNWPQVAKKTSGPFPAWTPVVTPLFPTLWPPESKKTSFVYFAYARSMDPTIRDGERVAAPWGRVVIDIDDISHSRMEILERDIRELGIQGFRPMMPDEIKRMNRGPLAEDEIVRSNPQASNVAPDVKEFYCQWIKLNGVIAQEIKKQVPAFFIWLHCP